MLTTDKPCYCGRRNYILGIKGRSSRIPIKGLQMITGPSYVTQPAKYDNDTNLRDKPLTHRLDSDFFLIGVNNLYLTSHTCISIRVMCLFRNQELESSIFSRFYKFCYFLNGYREFLACIIRGKLSGENNR